MNSLLILSVIIPFIHLQKLTFEKASLLTKSLREQVSDRQDIVNIVIPAAREGSPLRKLGWKKQNLLLMLITNIC